MILASGSRSYKRRAQAKRSQMPDAAGTQEVAAVTGSHYLEYRSTQVQADS
jgi:hypothetical protein